PSPRPCTQTTPTTPGPCTTAPRVRASATARPASPASTAPLRRRVESDMAGSRKLTPEERRERIRAAHEQLATAVETLLTSDGWQQMVTRRAWLRRYSINNLMLIIFQRPDASDVRPIREWNAVGRRVRKGEKGIRILAPCRYRARDDEGNPVTDDDGTPRYQVRGFKVVSVFDVSQTDGDPLPEPEAGFVPAELRGAAPEHLRTEIADQISEQGYTVERGDCGSAYGWTRYGERRVRVRDAVDEAQAVKTLVHELAHILCDHENRIMTVPRTVLEVEAESV